ncbi:MAG: glycosyltransferase family 2 protein, partial [Staphylothermus sp.]|nr:glycosyltransferase family 2 protein [Staphylothermus sp.]
MSKGKVALMVVTYNSLSKLGKGFLDKVVKSIFMQNYSDLEIVFVDNGSNDETPNYIEGVCINMNNCKVLRLKKNYGWDGANNRGAILVRDAEYFFFINDDVIILDRDLINKLVEVMSKYPELGAVQPLIIDKNGNLSYGLDLGFSGLSVTVSQPRGYPLFEPFSIVGTAFLTRSDAFFSVGMFDEDMFLYRDEEDYSWRLRLFGYRIACLANAKVYHWHGATLGVENPLKIHHVIRNTIWSIAKNSSLAYFLPRLILMLIEVLISYLGYALLTKRDGKMASAILRGILDGFTGLGKAFSKRIYVTRFRNVKDKEINKYMNILVDIN